MKKVTTFLLVAILALCNVWAPAAHAANKKIDYVALGDSLASGHTPYGEKVGIGFTDMISKTLAKKGVLGTFTKEYATSGETSVELLTTLNRPEVQQSIKDAELITIISGANDFIDELYNPSDESVQVDLEKATALLNTVAGNLTSAIQKVKALNPGSDIYLFGYYFPLPHIQDVTTKQQLQLAFTIVNSRLATIAQSEGVHFVEVATAFDLKGASYLENPKDIHPNEAGYQVIADQFFLNYSIPVQGTFPNTTGKWDTQFDKTEFVKSDKKWTITSTNDVDESSVQKAIFVVKDGVELMPVGIEVSKNNPKQIIITAPKQGYKTGSYQLMITNDLKDKAGKNLKTKVLMHFKVK